MTPETPKFTKVSEEINEPVLSEIEALDLIKKVTDESSPIVAQINEALSAKDYNKFSELRKFALKEVSNVLRRIDPSKRDDIVSEACESDYFIGTFLSEIINENLVNHLSPSIGLKLAETDNTSVLYDKEKEVFVGLNPVDVFKVLLKTNLDWMLLEEEEAERFKGFEAEIDPILADAMETEKLSPTGGIVASLAKSWLKTSFPKTYGVLAKRLESLFEPEIPDVDLSDYFLENFSGYSQEIWAPELLRKALLHYSVSSKFLNIAKNASWKDESWVNDSIKFAEEIVKQHEYLGPEGFKDKDPYEDHPWRFTTEQARLTTILLEASKGEAHKLSEIEFTLENWVPFLEKMKERIDSAYEKYIENSPDFLKHQNKDDVETFTGNNAVKLTPLRENITAFIVRYLVQSTTEEGSSVMAMGKLLESIDYLVQEAADKYQKIYEVDIPLYDKLYEEFDTLRETGRYPLEVYLGRDGVYAYIGRRAQDVARRRKLGLEGRKKLRDGGEAVEIHPQYTVYPRYFRDNIDYETKREFLEQEGISPEADPLFYDTGYTGTIPEQIMKIMDFDEDEIERRIRLLSAPSAHRRVKGVPENARSEIIEYIEHNVKTEESAEGLIKDLVTGKIRPIAKPTSPEEQFYFSVVKQAIGRHYWTQEKLHHEPSGNINLDSEHYTIRIREEYATLLPDEFKVNPQEYLRSHGNLLIKGSKGEGEYPDEEVILFSLSDGTEIVAKRIELRKAKEARKEFSILIAAKKAGLATADPVGFLSGKQDEDGSYLLMSKIEGISGRKFEKQLRESKKYTEEHIAAILQVVVVKNREMAELFRNTLQIDKRWRIKDTIIEFNDETGEVGRVMPIDWERAENFDSSDPKEID